MHSIEEAATYLEPRYSDTSTINDHSAFNSQISPLAQSETIIRTANFKPIKEAYLVATISFVRLPNGSIDLAHISTSIAGHAFWSWLRSSYTMKRLDGGRSLGIYMEGTLSNIISVDGQIENIIILKMSILNFKAL
ncbi:hypothetical protein MHB44_12230 [Lysinibacillus sp. FSL H8-0500]|uniref:hypothetical protein n=1 Tax=Lysinibacillus sp. FSL H8-0500 TaxID=2921393 RepID=UPI0031011861